MPQTLYTLRDIADLIARCEQRPEEPVFNQLKGLAGRNVLKAIPDFYGKKGALLFPEKEVLRARMLLAALDCGFSSDKLTKFDAQMRFDATGLDPITGKQPVYSFDAAVADLIRAFENPSEIAMWDFEVARVRIEGSLEFSGHWIVNNRRRGSDPDWSRPPVGFEGVTTFAFTSLVAPLYHAMKAED